MLLQEVCVRHTPMLLEEQLLKEQLAPRANGPFEARGRHT